MTRQLVRQILWFGFSILLIVILLRGFGSSFGTVIQTIVSVPLSLFVAVVTLTFLGQFVGALKWHVAHRGMRGIDGSWGFYKVLEVTNLGSLGAQFLPAQFSHLLVRWIASSKEENRKLQAMGSTVYEQVFDLILYVIAATLYVAYFWIGIPIWILVLCGMLCAAVLTVLLKAGLNGCRSLVRRMFGAFGFWKALAHFEEVTSRATEVSAIDNLKIFALSIVGLLLRGGKVFAITSVLAPTADAIAASAALPLAGLISILPITPAGLGAVEWTWSAVLVSAGAPAAAAALVAVSYRLISALALLVLAVLFWGIRGLREV
ncbi:lysylphosphatidylglycerol synthase domain-containing protein [Thalassovita aquimarina]|uniref:Flippase-like domain-containing protein n=1 Tax=Thalassovita aquimarina TaxID=2785917 RepID=A0ABS5HVF7_9RHOB|nr:lysylphosphatidylglycerol synthase domain-containing protein [Thalassovita aquimarina]MBR9652962.1 flippase-like domain-containing protein [Thalassovita aquimarina]